MKRLKINQENPEPEFINQALEILRSGGIVLHPTETVYGLAAVWDNLSALKKVAEIKGRSEVQPFSIMVHSVQQIFEIWDKENPVIRNILNEVFPAPLTVLLPGNRKLALDYWNRLTYLGFRCPDHPLSRNLLAGTGKPLITTSANISGEAPPKQVSEVDSRILSRVDLVLDGGLCEYKIPSTIIQIDERPLRYEIIRKGAFSVKEWDSVFRKFVK